MNKSVKGVAIVAAAMVTVGILLTGVGFMSGGMQSVYFDRDGIHVGNSGTDETGGGKLESFSQDIDSFSDINVDLDYYDVDLIPSDKFAVDGTYLSEDGKPTIKVENGTLTVKDTKHKIVNLNIDLPGLFSDDHHPGIKIYYPKNTKLKDVVISCDASDLSFENLTAEKAEFELDFGKMDLTNLSAKNIKVIMNSGDCFLKNITADELNINNDMGKITLNGGDLKSLEIVADSGDVSLTDVTADYGDLNVDMGKISAKELTSNGLKVGASSGDVELRGKLLGITDITCDMGKVTVAPGASRDLFNYELNADMGSVSIEGDKVSGNIANTNASAKNTLKITTDMGDINVDFE